MKAGVTISFTVRKSKSRCSGISPIQVLLTKNGVRVSFSTGHAVKPSEWDSKNQRVKGKNSAYIEINNFLNSVRARLYDKLWRQIDKWCIENLKGEDLESYYKTTY